MSRRISNVSLTVLMLHFLLALCPHASGQQLATIPYTIYVKFEIRVPEAKLNFDNPDDAERKIAQRLAEKLSTRFPWTFQQGRETEYPRLEIWLEHERDWDIHAALLSTNSAVPRDLGTAVVWPLGVLPSLGGFPKAGKWPDILDAALDNGLLIPKRFQLLEILKSVPLGVTLVGGEVVMIENPPTSVPNARSVLPLDWSKYGNLATSEFKIKCKHGTQGDPVELWSKGVGTFLEYKPGHRQFDGIVVQHVKWVSGATQDDVGKHLSEFVDLVPMAFYIEKLIEDDDPLFSRAQ